MKHFNKFLFNLLVFLSMSCVLGAQIEKISHRGYENCYRIYNDSVEVIIVADAGARVLS